MAGYVGSTATSTAANPPVVLASVIGGRLQYTSTGSTTPIGNLPASASGGKLWFYSSTNYADDAAAAAFFNDGQALGMSRGDVLIGVAATADSTSGFLYMGILTCSAGSTSFGISTLSMFKSTLNA